MLKEDRTRDRQKLEDLHNALYDLKISCTFHLPSHVKNLAEIENANKMGLSSIPFKTEIANESRKLLEAHKQIDSLQRLYLPEANQKSTILEISLNQLIFQLPKSLADYNEESTQPIFMRVINACEELRDLVENKMQILLQAKPIV